MIHLWESPRNVNILTEKVHQGFSQETWGHQQGRWSAPGVMGEESQLGGQGPETQVIRTSFCLCDLSAGPCPKLSFRRLLLCVSDTVFLLLI